MWFSETSADPPPPDGRRFHMEGFRSGCSVSPRARLRAAELSRLRGTAAGCRGPAPSRHPRARSACRRPTVPVPGRSCSRRMQRDKKSRGGMLRFIVLDDIARPTVLQAPDESLLFAAYQEVARADAALARCAASASMSGRRTGAAAGSRPQIRMPRSRFSSAPTRSPRGRTTSGATVPRRRPGATVAAQFVAVLDGEWGGQPLGARAGRPVSRDHLGRIVDDRRAFIVGVYVRPVNRGTGE